MVVPNGRHGVSGLTAGDFDLGPLGPEVESGRGFDHVGDVRPADAGGSFEEVELAVVPPDELGVGNPANEVERPEYTSVEID